MTNYQTFVKSMTDCDLSKLGYEVRIDLNKVSREVYQALEQDGFLDFMDNASLDENDYGSIYLGYNDVYKYNVDNAADWYGVWDDGGLELTTALEMMIKPADRHLVIVCSSTWNGVSGYKIIEDIKDAVYRDYEVTIRPVSVTAGGKVLTLRESSHDVPCGATTYVIALTNKEYEMIDNADNVWEYINKHFGI